MRIQILIPGFKGLMHAPSFQGARISTSWLVNGSNDRKEGGGVY